ncbi:MAG: methyl-accepting chemotaxis protein, partial [Planctomycetota bacterium]
DDLIAKSHDQEGKRIAGELRGVLDAFRASQDEIIAIAHEPANLPANLAFDEQALPLGLAMQAHLDRILELEHGVPATAERRDLTHMVAKAEIHLLRVTAAVTDYLVDGKQSKLDVIHQELAACSASVAKLTESAGLLTEAQRAEFDAYIATREQFIAEATGVLEIRSSDRWNQAEYLCAGTVTPLAAQADAIVARLLEHFHGRLVHEEEDLVQIAGSTQIVVIAASGVALLLSIGVAMLLARLILPPIKRAAAAAQQVAEGDLATRVPAQSTDECGDLGRAFNAMTERMSEMIAEVAGTSRDVAAAATEIAASSEEIAGGMSEQSGQVTQISSAVEQMSQSVIEVARKSAEASQNAERSGEMATEGGEVVRQTVTGMNAINEAVTASAGAVQELGKRGEQIGEVIQVINDIADQTNLLALNAAIEAARAGEHGRGFAVVADEVRKLADRTTKATEEIAESIQAIQQETDEAVQRMGTGTEQVEQGVEQANQAGHALEQIVGGAREVAAMIQSIAAAAEEQSAASEQVGKNVEAIAAVTREANEGTQQAATAAASLSNKAERLLELVGSFKVSQSGQIDTEAPVDADRDARLREAAQQFRSAA